MTDEADPDTRDIELDIYNPRCPNQPPYSDDFVRAFRSAQLRRIRARTAWVKEETTGSLKGRPDLRDLYFSLATTSLPSSVRSTA